jgi:hypothetical protein
MCKWDDNIKELGFKDVDWIHLAQDRVQWQALVNFSGTLLHGVKLIW